MNAALPHNPPSRRHQLTAGILIAAVPLLFMVFFTLLQMRFEYPDILRKPAAEVLTRFTSGGPGLIVLWYGMFASALLFIPLAVLLPRALPGPHPRTGLLVAGVLAGLVQAIGLSRWVFVVPLLASIHADPAASADRRAAAEVAFEVLNNLLGLGIGEHLGYLFTGVWTVLVAFTLRPHRPFLAAAGVLFAAGIVAGTLEPLPSMAWVGAVNAISYSLWSLWLVVLGVLLCLGRLTPPPR